MAPLAKRLKIRRRRARRRPWVLWSPRAASGIHCAVEAMSGADQRQMGKGLGKVSQVLAARAELLGIQTKVVGVAQHLLEDEARLVHVAGAGQRLHVPEGAHV